MSESLFVRYEGNPIITRKDLSYAANSIFNPGATKINNETILLTRVEDMRGISHLTIARSKDGLTGWTLDNHPTIAPEPEIFPEEIWGIEDPRIARLEELDCWAITYTAFSLGGPLVSLAMTNDFVHFEKRGTILPPEDKDAALFPRKFKGRWAMIHRPILPAHLKGHIWISFSPDLKHWGDYQVLIETRDGSWWDAYKIGLGPPPLETPEGWLILYHGIKELGTSRLYRLGLALLDLDDPTRVLKRSSEWIFGPEEHYERTGDVPNVVFPCGWVLDDDRKEIRLYYGCGDISIGVATARYDELLDYVLSMPSAEPAKIQF